MLWRGTGTPPENFVIFRPKYERAGGGVPLDILDVIDPTDTIVPNKHGPYARCWSAAVFIADFFTFYPLVTGTGYSCAMSTPRGASIMQPFRHIELIVHHILPGFHSHLCQVNHGRVKCHSQGHKRDGNMIFL